MELPVGAVEVRDLGVGEVAADGRLRRLEQFPESQPGRALARLYQLWAETAPEAERARAAIVARAVAAVTPPDFDALEPLLVPDLAFADRRTLGMGAARGAERYLRGLRTLLDVAADLRPEDEIIAADETRSLLRRLGTGTLRDGGGLRPAHAVALGVRRRRSHRAGRDVRPRARGRRARAPR